MSDAGGLVAQLAAAGTPPELLAAVAKELFAGEAARATIDERRRKDRARHPRKSMEVHGNPRASEEIQDRVSLDKKAPQTPEKINPIPCVRETRARGGYHRMPEGWRPTKPLPPQIQAKVDQWPPGALDDEIAAMKRWAANAADQAGKGRKKDWDKFYWNWIGRRHDERYRPRTNGMGRNQPSDGLSATTRAARDVFGLGAGH